MAHCRVPEEHRPCTAADSPASPPGSAGLAWHCRRLRLAAETAEVTWSLGWEQAAQTLWAQGEARWSGPTGRRRMAVTAVLTEGCRPCTAAVTGPTGLMGPTGPTEPTEHCHREQGVQGRLQTTPWAQWGVVPKVHSGSRRKDLPLNRPKRPSKGHRAPGLSQPGSRRPTLLVPGDCHRCSGAGGRLEQGLGDRLDKAEEAGKKFE